MKIKNITTHLLKEWRTMLFVVVETDDGTIGIGESGLTSREYAVAGMVDHLKTLLIGENAFDIEHHWQTMWRSGFHPSGQVLSSAMAAIDIALWDIKGKALDAPVYDLLGGRAREKVLSYCHQRGSTPEETLAAAKAHGDQGWKALRWEPTYGDDMIMRGRRAVDKAIEEFKLLRRELGPEIELAFDAHTKLTPVEAAYLCNAVADQRPMFIEDPLRSEYVDGYRSLRGKTAVPLAAGEQFASKWQFVQMLNDNLMDYCRVDLCIAGGLTEGRKIAAMCEARMVDLAVHNPIGPVSTAACLHLNLVSPNVLVQELPKRPGECLDDVIATDQTWEDGWLSCTGKPGLGVEVDIDAFKKYPFEPEHLPMMRREDGSYTNW